LTKINKHIKKEVSVLYRRLSDVLHFTDEDKNIDFFISSLTEFNQHYTTNSIWEWLSTLNVEQKFNVEQIPLDKMSNWQFDDKSGDLKHDSGGFFSIRGLEVQTNWGGVKCWTQPIIHQPEIGILGIIVKKINGIIYFLLQAKAEPGNINTYQLSPTVQATRSNYMKLHGGKSTLYLEYFTKNTVAEVLIDQLQSEQGARFYHKRNRNIIIRIPDNYDIELGPNHRWMTLGQIIRLSQKSNILNMDTRSVISCISYEPENLTSLSSIDETELENCLSDFSLLSDNTNFSAKLMISSHANVPALHTFDTILRKIARRKFDCDLNVKLIPMNGIERWIQTPSEIYHPDRKFFSIIGVHVESMHREIDSWDQPIIKQDVPGIVGFITKEINGVLHFLTQLKSECGVMDLLEISPTVQCITSNYDKDSMPSFVSEILHRENLKIVSDVNQSEEGGRFYHESNQHVILLANDSFYIEEGPDFIWMTMRQMKQLIKFNNYLNVEARSLLSCLPA
jgi:dTDP-4-dehydro-6-deoxy-alpha-D-glucopyranose 2,3-dehydratase